LLYHPLPRQKISLPADIPTNFLAFELLTAAADLASLGIRHFAPKLNF